MITCISIQRAEGPNRADFTRWTFVGEDLPKAQVFMNAISWDAPKGGGYDKVDVWVTEAGNPHEYKLRMDVKWWQEDDCDSNIEAHLAQFKKFIESDLYKSLSNSLRPNNPEPDPSSDDDGMTDAEADEQLITPRTFHDNN